MTGRHHQLHTDLAPYRATTESEREHLEAIRSLLVTHPTAFDRDEFEPGHITASAFVVHPNKASIALVLHRKLARWLQPGGHVEAGDPDMIAASRREVREETGLADLTDLGIVDVDVHEFPARGIQPSHLHLDVRYGFVSGTERLVLSGESTDVAWFGLDEMLEMDESLARPARRLSAMDAAGTLRPD